MHRTAHQNVQTTRIKCLARHLLFSGAWTNPYSS